MISQRFVELQERHTRLLDREEEFDTWFMFDMGDHIDTRRQGYEEAVDMLLAGHISMERFTDDINMNYEAYLNALEQALNDFEADEQDSG